MGRGNLPHGYAIECTLKFLLITLTLVAQRGKIMSLKNEFGHNLPRLRAGVIERGATFPKNVASELVFASSWSPHLRYEPGPGEPGEASRFIAAARTIVEWADGRM